MVIPRNSKICVIFSQKFPEKILKPTKVSHSSTPNQTGLPDFGSQDVTNIGRRDGPLTYRTGNYFKFIFVRFGHFIGHYLNYPAFSPGFRDLSDIGRESDRSFIVSVYYLHGM